MRTRMRTAWVGGAVASLALASAVVASTASADSTVGTATLTGGSLTIVTPAAVAFTASLKGIDQVVAATQAVDIIVGSGSGSGWNLTVTSTSFTAGSRTLPNDSAYDHGATGVCDNGVTCTLADNSATSYPVVIPSAVVAPAAIRIMSAAVDSGLGGQTWTHNMRLVIPGNAHAGDYTSTWTYSLVSAP